MTHKPPKPLSIKEAGGISNYLDLLQIRAKHNGLGTDDFKLRLRLGVPTSRIMKDFNVDSDTTIRNWKQLIKQEQAGEQTNTGTSDTGTEVGRTEAD